MFLKSTILFSIFFGFVIQIVSTRRIRSILNGNNACHSAKDYDELYTSKNCFFHVDSTLNGRELVQKYAPNYEEFKITTDDGYILTIFHIPRTNPKGVVLVVPTMFTDTKLAMVQGNDSTPMLLWQAGYDIWIYNTRGTQFSSGHVNISLSDYEYWDYRYDLSKTIRFVKNKTNSKMFVYGTSMAVTSSLIYASMLPEEAKESVNAFMLIGAPIFFTHSTSIIVTLMPALEDLGKELFGALQLGDVLPAIATVHLIVRFLFRIPLIMHICHWVLLLYFGWTWNEFDPAIVNTDSPLLIGDVSWKTAFHYLQIERTKTRFQRYDYGVRENKKIYGTAVPPRYPLENVTVPVFLIISDGDVLTAKKDAEYLLEQLPAIGRKYKPAYISGMNHGDYQYGVHRKERIVGNLLKFLEYARQE